MTVHAGNGVQFSVPDEWTDRSVVAFSPDAVGKMAAPSFVLTRERMPPADNLRTFSSRQLTQLAKGLREFSLKETRDVTLDGFPATLFEFTWLSPAGRILQRLTIAAFEREVVLFTATGSLSRMEELRGTFDQIMASVRLTPTAPSPAGPPGPSRPSMPPPSIPAPNSRVDDWLPGSKRR
jgi:hypothetical protein